jgi:hypothetical protein
MMPIEPYRRRASEFDEGAFADGRTWGDPLQTPDPVTSGRSPRGRGTNTLVLRARRAKTDPNWSKYPAATKRALVERDRRAGL